MKLFIIRHAQSTNNLLGETAVLDEYLQRRDAEPPLTELGLRQAELVAKHLAGSEFPEFKHEQTKVGYALNQIFCSPMLRTLQTALPISRATGVKPQVWLDIHEQGGIFHGHPSNPDSIVSAPGVTRHQLAERFPGFVPADRMSDEGWWFGGYETMDGCTARAAKVAAILRQWAPDRQDERIALVSHGTFVEALIRALLEMTPAQRTYYNHYNTAISRLDFLPDGYLAVRYLNRIQHLTADLVSR